MTRWFAAVTCCLLLFPADRLAAQANVGRITGTVTSVDGGSPLARVRVSVLGTLTTVETNPQGRYSISIAPGTYRLRVSALGYAPVVMDSVPVTAGGVATADFQLKHQSVELEKIVVVGYGTQAKRDVTGAVGSVSAEQIAEQPSTNAIEAIKGRVPGVDIVTTGYAPGSGIQIRIRGQRSITASNDPLYVLDGVPMAGNIGDINPGDIESIEILKDASATAIYGSRGANGVVLVTTKRGGNGRTRVTYDTYAATQSATRKVDVFNAAQYAEYKREAYRAVGAYNSALCPAGQTSCYAADVASNAFLAPELAALQAGNIDTDWQDLIRQTGSQINHQLSVSGGSPTLSYSASGNLMKQTGIIRGQDYDRKSMRLNLESHATPRLRLGGSALLVRSTQDVGRGDGLYSETLADSPLSSPYDSTGAIVFKPTPDPQRDNPLSDVNNYLVQNVRTRLFGTLFGTLTIADGLEYHVNFGPDLSYARQGQFQGAESSRQQGSPASAQLRNDRTFDYTLDNILTYRKALGADHKIDATFLYSIEKQSAELDSMRASGLPYESQLWENLGSGATVDALASNLAEWALQSYMGRLNYTFRDRYLLTLTGRLDGSSRLAPGRKYSFFPSAALAWRVVDEATDHPLGPLNSLKLRTSYGRTGNTSVNPYSTLGQLTRSIYAWNSSTPAYGFRPGNLENPDLGWEKTAQVDAGADFSLWNSRLTGTVDAYRATTTDLLLNRQLPSSTGFTQVTQNIGATRNTGVEVALSHTTLDDWHGIHWTNDLTWSANRNVILNAGQFDSTGTPIDDIGNRWFIGQPIDANTSTMQVWYDYKMIGIWQLDEAAQAATYGRVPGDIKIEDVNGDGKIDANDRQILGNTYPKWSGSWNTRVDYGRVDLSAQVITRQGFMIHDTFLTSQATLAGRYNGIAVDYWTPTNPSNTEPRPNKNQEGPTYGDARGYEDGSFTRIRSVTLGVTVPPRYAQMAGAQSLRLYTTGQNLFTFTSSQVLDPEGRASAGTPAYRTILLGANVGF